jgi:hypothetical protein
VRVRKKPETGSRPASAYKKLRIFLFIVLSPCLCGFQERADLPALWRSVDAVVLAKVVSVDATSCQANVLELFRRHFGGPRTGFTLTSTLKAGDEFVAFLQGNANERTYQARLLLPVHDGKLRTASIDGLPPEMDLEAFLVRLRSMQE